MKKYLNLAPAFLASLKPKSKIPIIDTYGQSTLNQDEQQALMEWLFARKDGRWVLRQSLPDLGRWSGQRTIDIHRIDEKRADIPVSPRSATFTNG